MNHTSASFKTRARTIDHLGREQIADCPTAISELWKNSYDAYSKNVALHIMDGSIPVACIVDDGHGMSLEEFETKWLTIGTESKATNESVTKIDRKGNKKVRAKQGQKGIGRLSCAALGSLLLIISKRFNSPYVLSLIDWRLFENPFLMLHDIKVPIAEVEHKEDILSELPGLIQILKGNILGDSDDLSRDARIIDAWQIFDNQETNEKKSLTSEAILKSLDESIFTERNLMTWPVWKDQAESGTAMFMANIPFDLESQLSLDSINEKADDEARAQLKLLETLSNFTDPFLRDEEQVNDEFYTSIIIWNGQLQRILIDDVREFDISDIDELEHIIDGEVNEEGYFKGRVKAFGTWHEDVIIKPARYYKTRSDSRFGAFKIRLASFEVTRINSSLPQELFELFMSKQEVFGGLRLYRDGLRVMPYGREDNDYFEIEKRRSKNAGQYFWSARKIFGRIAISREGNPNLKDKAGREGFLDNRAAMLFREIIIKILIDSANRYFGRNSNIRSFALEDIRAENLKAKALADRKKLLRKERKRIKSAIDNQFSELSFLVNELREESKDLAKREEISSLWDAKELKERVSRYSAEIKEFSLSPIPPSLGTVEESYRDYRSSELEAKELIKHLELTANTAIDKFITKSDSDIALTQFRTNRGYLTANIKKWATEGRNLLRSELDRFESLVSDRNKSYDTELASILEDLELNKVNPSSAIRIMDEEFEKQELENAQRLKPYITAISNIRDQIDLEGLAIHSLNESTKWKEEAERLNSLAQLGITVEIIGHEIEGLDISIENGLKELQRTQLTDVQKNILDRISYAHQGLSDRWRFLSPLKLSGDKVKAPISGQDIFDYVNRFYGEALSKRDISFEATASFMDFSIYDYPSRILPVFINLINNSRYWVNQNNCDEKKIVVSMKNNEVFVSDTGPGVDRMDIESLFTLFFTRKQRGGRGVGLYLCRTNLSASGHAIRYEVSEFNKILPGANFAIKFGGK